MTSANFRLVTCPRLFCSSNISTVLAFFLATFESSSMSSSFSTSSWLSEGPDDPTSLYSATKSARQTFSISSGLARYLSIVFLRMTSVSWRSSSLSFSSVFTIWVRFSGLPVFINWQCLLAWETGIPKL